MWNVVVECTLIVERVRRRQKVGNKIYSPLVVNIVNVDIPEHSGPSSRMEFTRPVKTV